MPTATLSNSRAFNGVAPGTYTVSASPVAGFALTAVACADTGTVASSGQVATRTATIGLEPGEDITCTFTHELTPSVTIERAAAQNDPTNTGPVRFTVVFSEPVTGFASGDVTLAGTAGATTAVVSGGPSVFTVDVSGMVSDGTVVANIGAGVASRAAGSTTNSASTSIDNSVVYDTTRPTVTINQAAAQTDPTNAATVAFTVVFSEPVSGFTGSDVTLSGTAGATSAVVTGGPSTYTVNVTGIAADGTVVATISAGVTTDAAGNTNTVASSTDNTVLVDRTAPTVTINQAGGQVDPTKVNTVNFTVVFASPVTGFGPSDVALSGTAGATTVLVEGGPTTYTVAASGMTGDGTIVATIGSGAATDAAGNASVASTSTDNRVSYDATAPTVTVEQAAAQSDPTNGDPIRFTVTFSEAVTGFVGSDVSLTGTAGATTAVASGGPLAYTIDVSGMTDHGSVIASIATGVAVDSAGNASTASTSLDNSVNYDATRPTVTINQAAAQADPTNALTVAFTVVFSEPVSGFTGADVTLGGTAGATSAVVTGGPRTYTVDVSGMTGSGTVAATIAANVAADSAGNTSLGSTSTDNVVLRDISTPLVTIDQAATQVDPTALSPIRFSVAFSEPVTGFAATDVSLTGTAGATTAVVSGGPALYTVDVSGMTSDGTVTATVADRSRDRLGGQPQRRVELDRQQRQL